MHDFTHIHNIIWIYLQSIHCVSLYITCKSNGNAYEVSIKRCLLSSADCSNISCYYSSSPGTITIIIIVTVSFHGHT